MARTDIFQPLSGDIDHGIVTRPIPILKRVYRNALIRRILVLVALALSWQAYAVFADNALLFPTLVDTAQALYVDLVNGVIPQRVAISLQTLVIGYALGIALAVLLTTFAMVSLFGASLLETLTAMLNPLPAIALLPLALLWFGLGQASLLFVLVHSVMWVVAMNTYNGFLAVSQTLRMVGRNYGLGPLGYVRSILFPAAFPSILSGLKVGWAFAWRALVAAELIFGVSSGGGGLGWYIFEKKNAFEIPSVFAGLLAVIVIGLLVDSFIFRTIERRTIQRWGMHEQQ